MQLEQGKYCPLVKKDCLGLKCAWFTKIQGYDINSGKQIDEWNCAINWLPMLLIENSGQQRSTGAAVESFRNEMVKANEITKEIFMKSAGIQIEQSKINLIEGEDSGK